MIPLAIALMRVFVYQFTSKYSYSQDARAYTHPHTQASTPPPSCTLPSPLPTLTHTNTRTHTHTQTPTFTTDCRFIKIMNRMQQSIATQCNRCVHHDATDKCDAIPATRMLFSTIAPKNYCNTLQQITATQGIQWVQCTTCISSAIFDCCCIKTRFADSSSCCLHQTYTHTQMK